MSSFCRHSLTLAAVVSIAAGLSMTTPVVAAEPIPARDVVKPVAAKSPTWHVSRRAVSRTVWTYDRRLAAARSDTACFGPWCGRQYVLMLGIGY